MKLATERRLLQVVTAAACVVPLSMGLLSVLRSTEVIQGTVSPPTDLDSHYRYLSGILLGIGIAILWSIPKIETRGTVFRTLGFVIVIGGLARLWSLLQVGPPSFGHQFGLAMELLVVPLVVFWQARLEKRWANAQQVEGPPGLSRRPS